mgnify:FL=1
MENSTKQKLSKETLELIEELKDSHELEQEDLLAFIEEHGEDNFNEYADTYYELLETNDQEVIDDWLEIFRIEDIEHLEENYEGQWETGADYAENTCTECGYIPRDMPAWIKIDWEETWDDGLSWDYSISDNGHVFRTSW